MKNLYGLFSLAGFMGTMMVYAVLGLEASKLDLTVIFLLWIVLEGILAGLRQLFRRLRCNKKWTGVKPPARFTLP